MTRFVLAPNGRWSARELTGVAAVNGSVQTFENQTNIPKDTYTDPSGTVPNPNPVPLDGKGEANIYWADDELYTIIVRDNNGNLIYSQDNYPTVEGSGGGSITVIQSNVNQIRNPYFGAWIVPQENNAPLVGSLNFTRLGSNIPERIADDWGFFRQPSDATVEIRRVRPAPGLLLPNNMPSIFILNYQCTNIGGIAEIEKFIFQGFDSVKNFEGQEVVFRIYVANDSTTESAPISVDWVQNFGSGGSPSPVLITPLGSTTLMPSSGVVTFTGGGTIPSTSGKTIGTNYNDMSYFNFNLPLNQLADLSVLGIEMYVANTLPPSTFVSTNDLRKKIDAYTVEPRFTTGDIKFSIFPIVQPGWLLLNDGDTLGSAASGATHIGYRYYYLFAYIWTYSDNTHTPIFTSTGAPSTRGASYDDDWEAGKRLSVPSTAGRVMGGQGNGRISTGFDGNDNPTLTKAMIPPHVHTYTRYSAKSEFIFAGPDLWSGDATANTGDGSADGLAGDPYSAVQRSAYYYVLIKL